MIILTPVHFGTSAVPLRAHEKHIGVTKLNLIFLNQVHLHYFTVIYLHTFNLTCALRALLPSMSLCPRV